MGAGIENNVWTPVRETEPEIDPKKALGGSLWGTHAEAAEEMGDNLGLRDWAAESDSIQETFTEEPEHTMRWEEVTPVHTPAFSIPERYVDDSQHAVIAGLVVAKALPENSPVQPAQHADGPKLESSFSFDSVLVADLAGEAQADTSTNGGEHVNLGTIDTADTETVEVSEDQTYTPIIPTGFKSYDRTPPVTPPADVPHHSLKDVLTEESQISVDKVAPAEEQVVEQYIATTESDPEGVTFEVDPSQVDIFDELPGKLEGEIAPTAGVNVAPTSNLKEIIDSNGISQKFIKQALKKQQRKDARDAVIARGVQIARNTASRGAEIVRSVGRRVGAYAVSWSRANMAFARKDSIPLEAPQLTKPDTSDLGRREKARATMKYEAQLATEGSKHLVRRQRSAARTIARALFVPASAALTAGSIYNAYAALETSPTETPLQKIGVIGALAASAMLFSKGETLVSQERDMLKVED